MNRFCKSLNSGLLCAAICFSAACSNSTKKEKEATVPSAEPGNTHVSTAQNSISENTMVRFKVNGVDANTKAGAGNDNTSQLGIVNGTNSHLSFVLNGDEAKFPFRGSLSMSLDNFSFKAGVYSCHASFSRYQRSNAAGEIQYDSQRGGNFSIIFSSITKSADANMVDEVYNASGTFSGKLGLKMGFEKDSDIKMIEITEGYFENVPIQVYGKN